MKTYKVFCPLINFQILTTILEPLDLPEEERKNLQERQEKELVEGIDVFDGVKIRRISEEDLKDIELDISYLMPREVVKACSFVLEKCITEEDDLYKVDSTLRNVVLAMRLLKDGYVSGSDVFCTVVSEKRLPYFHIFSRRRQWLGVEYSMNFQDLPALSKIVKAIERADVNNQRGLHLAFRRFQSGLEDEDYEDQLIDFWIAFEALFLKGGNIRASHGQIVAIACSVLLGRNDAEREEIRQTLSMASWTRNCIVHGSQHPFEDRLNDLDKFVGKIEEYLRESIKRFLDQV